MTEQLRILPGEDPDALVRAALDEHRSVATVCLFSGGGDSLVAAHRCLPYYDELVFIDTGTAVPGVEEFVVEVADWLGKPLRIMRQDFDAYRLLVLGGKDWKGDEWEPLGFPGPAQHGRAYNRLKSRPLEELLRTSKVGHRREARVVALTGVRRAESARRATRAPVNRKGSLVFVNPLIDWTGEETRRYRREQELPESPVAALLHRSGECNCGAFAAPGEREMLRSLWPDWFEERIAPIEREAEALGLPSCRWGTGREATRAAEPAGELCSSCELRLDLDLGERCSTGT